MGYVRRRTQWTGVNIDDGKIQIDMPIDPAHATADDLHKSYWITLKTWITSIANALAKWATKQDTLVSGTNIKTINSESLLGSGNINISGGATDTITTNIKYGRLYNFPAISNADFAPVGWHVPTQTEFETLITELGGSLVAGGAMKETGLAYWDTPNTGATNTSGLNCLGNGVRDETGVFSDLKASSNLHSITESGDDNYSFVLAYDTAAIDAAHESKIRGKAVRLIKDDSTNPGSLTDIDGNVYRTVKIGDQVWLADNWACTKLNDGTPIAEITDNTEWAADETGAYCNYNNDITNVFKDPAFEEWLISNTDLKFEIIQIACSDLTTNNAAATNVAEFHMPFDGVFYGLPVSSLDTVCTGSTHITDINLNGVTILSTKLSIDASESNSLTAATPCVVSGTTFAKGDKISIDRDQVGATIPGKGHVVSIPVLRT